MDHLQTEARNPASTRLDELSPLEIVRLMNAEDARVAPAVAAQAEGMARAIEVIADRLRKGGRLIYAGAGTSGRLGVLDASECPPTFNSPPEQVVGLIAGGPQALTRAVEGAEDHPEHAERDLEELKLGAKDVLVGIATSGRTPYVLGAVAHARKLGAFTIGISCNEDSELRAQVDLAITPIVGPEVLSGSTRLKAGTATKLVLNMLSTGAMVRLGKTFGNLMVDLRATNSKLLARTNRIVRILTGLSQEQSADLLRASDGELKTALVSHLANVSAEEARARLQVAGGQVGAAIGVARPESSTGVVSAEAPPGPATLVLGIDGGGTHTVALLEMVDEAGSHRIVGRGESGPSNLQSVGVEAALRALGEAVQQAFTAANIPRVPVVSACAGLAGADRPEDQILIRDWARQVQLAEHLEVTSDAALLLAAGTPEGWGLALVAGTGSMALGRNRENNSARAGGWGYLLGDEGSGYAIVLAALRAVVRAADQRGPATALTATLLDRMSVKLPQDLIAAVYRGSWDRSALAGLAPLVLEAAEKSDEVACRIVEDAARELALTAAVAARRLDLPPAFPLALAGGLLVSSESYRHRVVAVLKEGQLAPGPVTVVAEPAQGAVRLALGHARNAQVLMGKGGMSREM